MRYHGYDQFMHRFLAQRSPHAAALTRDQFDLWWRSLSDDERASYDTEALLRSEKEYMRNLYEC